MSRDLGEHGTGGGPLLAGRSPEPAGSSPPVSFGDYAPSPNTSSHAVHRANQLRVQNLLRRLLVELDESVRIDTVRVLRRTLREIDYQLSWLTQVDFLETIERLLSNEYQQQQQQRPISKNQDERDCEGGEQSTGGGGPDTTSGLDTSWRLVHDATQLLIEAVGRLEHEIDQQLVEAIVPSVVENLGHQRSEVRRASLLLLNLLLNEKPGYFKLLMRLFIDYGLTNYRNKQAQRGSILSLPLLVSEPIVERGEDLTPLIRCLSELMLIDSNEQLFYSLYLAMQRIHMMIGDQQFQAILRHCEPEAAHLYRQAASRNNSLALSTGSRPDGAAADMPSRARRSSSNASKGFQQQQQQQRQTVAADEKEAQQHQASRQHVTFEPGYGDGDGNGEEEPAGARKESSAPPVNERDDNEHASLNQQAQEEERLDENLAGSARSDSQLSTTASDESLSMVSSSGAPGHQAGGATSNGGPLIGVGRQFSTDVSSTCSSDAHLVNPAHYMTKEALQGHPLDHYEEIHHVDHSNITGLAINDFGPICNTPTIEFNPQLSAGIQTSLGQHLRANHQCDSPAAAMALLSSELKFGIFPRHLIQVTLHSARASDRYEAMQELMCIIRESPINHLAILMTYFDSFLEQFLAVILLGSRSKRQHQQPQYPQTDCKLELVAIDMVETIIIKTKVSTMQYIRPIVSLLMRALAIDSSQQANSNQQDNTTSYQQQQYLHAAPSIFRENTCRVLHKMMAYLPPQHVIDACFEHKHSKNWIVREEAINRVTAAILEYDRNEFNLTKLCYHVLPMLADQSASVRLASLECIATLAHVLGPERIGSLLTAAEAVQTGCDYDGLLDAINARLMRHTLPRCQSNGIVRYALKPFLAHHQFQSSGGAGDGPGSLAADVRWVLESPALHHHHQFQAGSQHEPTNNGHQQHHHHRLGVYSPPTQEELRRRRSSVGVPLHLDSSDERPVRHQHHHQLNHHHHKSAGHNRSASMSSGQHQKLVDGEPHEGPKRQSSDPRERDTSGKRQSAELDNSENTRRDIQATGGDGGGSGKPSDMAQHQAPQTDTAAQAADRRRKSQSQLASVESGTTAGRRRESSINKAPSEARSQSRKPSDHQHEQQHQQSYQEPRSQQQRQSIRRSNSQDSVSSTDTNKVLFQFYLGKFKQSLADSSGNPYQAVLPSDSIIYTDINQAYEFSRHQSRFQQTSFENEAEQSTKITAGRHADGSSPASVAPQGSNLNKNTTTTTTTNNNNNTNTQQETRTAAPSSRKRSSLARMGSSGGLQDITTTDEPVQVASRRPSKEHQKHTRHGSISAQAITRQQQQLQQQQQRDEEHNDETSGSESPQTVREAGGAAGSVHSSGKSRPPIQRQPTVSHSDHIATTGPSSSSASADPRRRYSSPERPGATGQTSRGSASSGVGVTNRRQSVIASGGAGGSAPGSIEEVETRAPTEEQSREIEAEFRAQRRRSQSAPKRSSADGQAGATSEHAPQNHHHQQQQLSSSRDGSRLARQESETTTVSSLASTSASSANTNGTGQPGLELKGRPEDDDELQTSRQQLADEHQARRGQSERDSGDTVGRRRSSSQRRRARSRPRTSGDRGEGEEPSGEQVASEREARRRASRSQPPVARSRNLTEHNSEEIDEQHQQAHDPDHPKAARLIRVRHQSNHMDQHQQQHRGRPGAGLVTAEAGGGGLRASSVSPGLSNSVNIRQILENVAQLEGPFGEPQLALKVAMSALDSACWSTKVEGLLALIRIAAHHPDVMLADNHLHEIVAKTADETRNLRSTVARAAIFALGDYCASLKRAIEPEMDLIVKALLSKSIENTAFIRDDIRRALNSMVEHLTPWRLATLLVNQGAQHKSVHVRRMTSQFVALIVDRMGPAKALVGAREISHLLLPAAARFAQDQSPHTRYYGRLIISKLMHHSSFERLLRRNLPSTLYRSTIGIIESIKRRGCGAQPEDV